MNGYLVVEGLADEAALRRAWAREPSDPLGEAQIVVAGDRTRLDTVARSLLVDGRSPVVILGDADTTDAKAALERQSFIESRLREVASSGWLVRLLPAAVAEWVSEPSAARQLAREVSFFIQTQASLVEHAVVQYLERWGWHVVERDPRLSNGRRADFLVAKNGLEAFVEVKEAEPRRLVVDELIGYAVGLRPTSRVIVALRDTPSSRSAIGPALPSLQALGGISILLAAENGAVDEILALPQPSS